MKIKEYAKKTIELYDKFAKRYHFYNKDKLLQYELNNFISLLPRNPKILDAGCGTGRDAQYLAEENCEIIGIDIAEGMLKIAKENVKNATFKKMDMVDLKFDNEEFDGILSMASIVNIPKKDVENVLNNFHKILKKKGILFLTTREGDGEQVIEDKKYDNYPRFFAFYKKEELEKLIKKNKFKILKSELVVYNRKKYIQFLCEKI